MFILELKPKCVHIFDIPFLLGMIINALTVTKFWPDQLIEKMYHDTIFFILVPQYNGIPILLRSPNIHVDILLIICFIL